MRTRREMFRGWTEVFDEPSYPQRHDFIGDKEEQQMEVRHDVQESRGAALGQVCC